jgi:hypothetical protein
MRPLDRLSLSFFGARFTAVPLARSARSYHTQSTKVSIVKHHDPTYYMTLRLADWDVITLLEVDLLLARKSIRQHDVPLALKKLARQKGLSTERRLHSTWRNKVAGYGVLEYLMDDANISKIHIRAVNDLVHCTVDQEEFGHCHTNIKFTRGFVDDLSQKYENPLGGKAGWDISMLKSSKNLHVVTFTLVRK